MILCNMLNQLTTLLAFTVKCCSAWSCMRNRGTRFAKTSHSEIMHQYWLLCAIGNFKFFSCLVDYQTSLLMLINWHGQRGYAINGEPLCGSSTEVGLFVKWKYHWNIWNEPSAVSPVFMVAYPAILPSFQQRNTTLIFSIYLFTINICDKKQTFILYK